MKRTPLVRSRRLNTYSLNKIAELNAEAPIRYQLIARCHGIPHETIRVVYHSGKKYTIRRVDCIGGYCECGRPECKNKWAGDGQRLHPHEKLSRGQGGKLSLENTVMVLDACHAVLQNNNPKWGSNADL